MTYDSFRAALLDWYGENGRTFYWREQELSPFEILVTEMFLVRTRVDIVDQYGVPILDNITSPHIVIQMDEQDLVSLLEPLGLQNTRAKNMQKVCSSLIQNFNGEVPSDRDELISIPGLGPYVADAVSCFAFGKPTLVVDINTIKVAEFFFNISESTDATDTNNIRECLGPLITPESSEKLNWALIDLGADIGKSKKPATDYDIPQMEC